MEFKQTNDRTWYSDCDAYTIDMFTGLNINPVDNKPDKNNYFKAYYHPAYGNNSYNFIPLNSGQPVKSLEQAKKVCEQDQHKRFLETI